MDDLWYRCVFEAERIVRQGLQKVDAVPSSLGNFYYRTVYFHSPMLKMNFKKRVYWFVDDAPPSFSQQHLVKVISEYLDFLLRYGGLDNEL